MNKLESEASDDTAMLNRPFWIVLAVLVTVVVVGGLAFLGIFLYFRIWKKPSISGSGSEKQSLCNDPESPSSNEASESYRKATRSAYQLRHALDQDAALPTRAHHSGELLRKIVMYCNFYMMLLLITYALVK